MLQHELYKNKEPFNLYSLFGKLIEKENVD